MKRLTLLFVCAGVLLSGCVCPDCFRSVISTDPTTLSPFSWEGNSENVNVITTSCWQISASTLPDWVTATPMNGYGTTEVVITAKENEYYTPRDGKIIFLAENGDRAEVLISQEPKIYIDITVDPEEVIFTFEAQTSSSAQTLLVTCEQDGGPAPTANWTLVSSQSWLTLSFNSNGSANSATLSGTGDKTVYLVVAQNAEISMRTAEVSLSGSVGVAVTVIQTGNPTSISGGGTAPTGAFPYVGAFWQANQIGERVIYLHNMNDNSENQGDWSASIAWYDARWSPASGDGVVLLAGGSQDPDIYTDTPGNAEDYPVTGGAAIVSGTVNNTTPNIAFRIGLQKTFAAFKNDDPTNPANDANYTTTFPARYAVVLLSYNNGEKHLKIFIRQGQGSDYLMRPQDPGMSGESWGISNPRPEAKRFTPYNLTATRLNEQVDLPGAFPPNNPTLFTSFPTQAGALFQWVNLVYPRYAWDAVLKDPVFWDGSRDYVSFWDALSANHETCPVGYRRPNDGPTNAISSGEIIGSEMRQSLFFNATAMISATNTSPSNDNIVEGYYADGFFDRSKIIMWPDWFYNTALTSIFTADGYKVAHKGVLFFNPTTHASLFFPASGYRSELDGRLWDPGYIGKFITSSVSPRSTDTGDANWFLYVGQNDNRQTWAYKFRIYSIRCVRR